MTTINLLPTVGTGFRATMTVAASSSCICLGEGVDTAYTLQLQSWCHTGVLVMSR
jgi:hypothetical protein